MENLGAGGVTGPGPNGVGFTPAGPTLCRRATNRALIPSLRLVYLHPLAQSDFLAKPSLQVSAAPVHKPWSSKTPSSHLAPFLA